jgi:hypothetical protein
MTRISRRRYSAAVSRRVAAVLLVTGVLFAAAGDPAHARIKVRGAHLVDHGRVVRLLGVNRSGTEYMCTNGFGDVFDGPHSQASVSAMRSWRINAVRVPLNESCWLGVGRLRRWKQHYRRRVVRYVRLLQRNHLYVILDNHFAAPGRGIARHILPMPSARSAPAFWRSVGRTFRRSPGVLFDLYNEPNRVGWSCWLHGCRIRAGRTPEGARYGAYRAAGMGRLLRELRSTGARQPVLLAGIRWSLNISRWVRYRPRDPRRQLVVKMHTYGPFSNARAARCFAVCQRTAARIARRRPLVIGELGEYDCAHGYVDEIMPWADRHGISYLAWAWDAVAPGGWQCDSGPALIQDYRGTPTAFGVGVRDHLRSLARR